MASLLVLDDDCLISLFYTLSDGVFPEHAARFATTCLDVLRVARPRLEDLAVTHKVALIAMEQAVGVELHPRTAIREAHAYGRAVRSGVCIGVPNRAKIFASPMLSWKITEFELREHVGFTSRFYPICTLLASGSLTNLKMLGFDLGYAEEVGDKCIDYVTHCALLDARMPSLRVLRFSNAFSSDGLVMLAG